MEVQLILPAGNGRSGCTMSAQDGRKSAGNERPRPSHYRLRLPGPTAVPARVRAALAEPMISHRGTEFREILADTARHLQPLFGSKNVPLLFGCSGTGVMEAALVNVLAPGERVLVVCNGQWGERFAAIG